jgi:hypothetical protein
MNRKVTFAVGTAAAVAFTGVASASDMLTINDTNGYVGASVSAAFIPWVIGECNAPAGGTSTIGCPDHGYALVTQAAGDPLNIGEPNYFTGGDAVPLAVFTPNASWSTVGPTGDNPFMSGIFREDGTSYFSGLGYACDTPAEAIANNCLGMGGPANIAPAAQVTRQQEWVDQTLVGYVESIRDANGDDQPDAGGDVTLAQNFRVQFNMGGTFTTNATETSHIDQRLEQMVELDGATGQMDNMDAPVAGGLGTDASRQTIQQAFGVNAVSSGNPTADGGGGHFMLGQLVAQDIEGFFFSCISCDSDINPGDHAVTPSLIEVRYQPYLTGWDVVPTIIHGGQ